MESLRAGALKILFLPETSS